MPKRLEQVPGRWSPPTTDRKTITLHLKTITPMFGGGHSARELDIEQPVRPAAIRGALRFWWRATTGAKATNLYKSETELWGRETEGGRPSQSQVSLCIQTESVPESVQYNPFEAHQAWPGYALFPFRTQQDGTPAAHCLPPGLSFRLCLTYPTNVSAEIETALAAWVYLGGIGARTRRGCGSLSITEPGSLSLAAVGLELAAWPTLPGEMLLGAGSADNNPITAWRAAVEAYAKYRTVPSFARDPHGNPDEKERPKPGRSYWPEPDAIRRIAGTHKHQPYHSTQIGFPRADLGLPIIFHYQQDRRLLGREPEGATLEGGDSGFTRFASPVITKPHFYQGAWRPMILILGAPPVWTKNIVLKHSKGKTRAITQSEIDLGGSYAPINSLKATDVRDGLRRFLLQQGFQSVGIGGTV
jgi:CRISPR-associated protein Cmr1